MKSDLHLIRKMVLAIEDSSMRFANQPYRFKGYSEVQVGYHAYYLLKKHLAEGEEVTTHDSEEKEAILSGLTPKGHAFVENVRNETWYEQVIKKCGAMAVELSAKFLAELAKNP